MKTDKSQHARFVEAAREAGADTGDPYAADTLLGRLARMPPEPKVAKPTADRVVGDLVQTKPASKPKAPRT